MRIIKLIALSLAMMLSLNGIASAESTLNKILSSGVLKAGAVLPLLAVIGFTGLELLVAALQADVFSILTCMSLQDALHLHSLLKKGN